MESGQLNQAERKSLSGAMLMFAKKAELPDERTAALLIAFIHEPALIESPEDQKLLLGSLRNIVEQGTLSPASQKSIISALERFESIPGTTDKLKKAAAYLLFRLKNPGETPTWDKIEKR